MAACLPACSHAILAPLGGLPYPLASGRRATFGSPWLAHARRTSLSAPLRPQGVLRLARQVQLVQLLEDAVHLGQHLLALLPQGPELRALALQRLDPRVEAVALRPDLGDGLRGPFHRLLELLEPFHQILCHVVPLTSPRKRSVSSFTILA